MQCSKYIIDTNPGFYFIQDAQHWTITNTHAYTVLHTHRAWNKTYVYTIIIIVTAAQICSTLEQSNAALKSGLDLSS